MNFSISGQLPIYLATNGSGLNNGKIYIGMPSQDPQLFPKTVYWDQAGTDPVDQVNGIPTIGGYISRAGNPTTIYMSGEYSIRVLDRFGAQVYYLPEVSDLATILGSTDGASLIGTADGSNVQSYLTAIDRSTLYSSRFPTLLDALTAWSAHGGELVIDEDYDVAAPAVPGLLTPALDIMLTPNQEYVLSSVTNRTITYVGPASCATLLRIGLANGTPLRVSGVTFNGNDLTNKPLWVDGEVEGSNRQDLDISGTFLNAYGDTVGRGDVTGCKVTGGFRQIYIHDFYIENVSRAPGVNDIGFNGSQGLQVFGAGLKNYKALVIERGIIRNVTTTDPVNSNHYVEMDGISAFQEPEDGVRAPTIRDMIFWNCVGRAIKCFAPGSSPTISNFEITRTIQGIGAFAGTGSSVDIDIQGGWGTVRDGIIRYRNAANVTKTVPISITANYDPLPTAPFGPVVIENILIDDNTAALKQMVADVRDNSPAGNLRRSASLSNIRDTGLAEALFIVGKGGVASDCRVAINNVECDVSIAATLNDAETRYLFVTARQLVNRNGTVRPVKVTYAGAMKVVEWGDWLGDHTVRGFARYTGGYRGNAAFTNGFRGPGGGVEAAPVYGESEVAGLVVPAPVTLAAAATWTGPPVGLFPSNAGDYTFSIRIIDGGGNDYVRVAAVAGGTALTTLDALTGSLLEIGSAGSNPATPGKLSIWKLGATQLQKVTNNTAGTLTFQPVYNG